MEWGGTFNPVELNLTLCYGSSIYTHFSNFVALAFCNSVTVYKVIFAAV